MTEIDLKSEIPAEQMKDVRDMAVSFFRSGGALTFDEWSHFSPSARELFLTARDMVELDRFQAFVHLLRVG